MYAHLARFQMKNIVLCQLSFLQAKALNNFRGIHFAMFVCILSVF